MALEGFGLEMLLALRAKGAAMQRVVMIGRQNLRLPPLAHQQVLERRFEVSLSGLASASVEESYAEPLFMRLGASSVESIDHSAYEGAGMVHDMNLPVPVQWHGQYDIVLDGGSLEHVFHVPIALANVMQLVRPGGHFVGIWPANNWNGHGFFQFSPELAHQVFCSDNGFSVVAVALGVRDHYDQVYRVPSPDEAGQRIDFNDGRKMFTLVCAKKVSEAVPFAQGWPQQADYTRRWKEQAVAKKAQRRGLIARALNKVLPGRKSFPLPPLGSLSEAMR